MLFKYLFTNTEMIVSVKFIAFYPLKYSLSPSLGFCLIILPLLFKLQCFHNFILLYNLFSLNLYLYIPVSFYFCRICSLFLDGVL